MNYIQGKAWGLKIIILKKQCAAKKGTIISIMEFIVVVSLISLGLIFTILFM